MSGQLQGGSPSNHSLAFRVMRLCRPSFQAEEAVLRLLDPLDLLAAEDILVDPSLPPDDLLRISDPSTPDAVANSDFTFRDRFQIRNPVDAMALSGLLIVPQSFGNIYLGETFSSYISVNNSSKFEARDVIIKAEIQTERQRILLLDTSKSPVESIRSGGRYDFIVEHDVKELGPHTLVCTALYNDGDSERKYLPQFFKFIVNNPLSVRTKVRTVKDNTYLEACIENHTKSNLYMDQVEFEPSQQWTATRLETSEYSAEANSETRGLLKPPVLIRAGGGIYNYLYVIKSTIEEFGQSKVDGSSILGKFQITWRMNLGEPGRLQTQQIYGTPITQKDIELQMLDIPPIIILERPFQVHLSITNQTDRTLGPFEVFTSPGISNDEKFVMVNGIQKLVLPPLEASNSNIFDMNLIATGLGVQKISGITIFDVREKKLYDPLPDVEIFVDTTTTT
ncbi:trafficking protein particle complex subunit 13-like [Zingiber officinale]|uniref:trafficking protein particle complex subunit 13-like n=1 Tax=Zingiber officinale TaxID=94328 RepID=UPI001C4C5A64|nr:trafficking protein particle complex subunit 13-like [Zingiber officinale]